MKLALDTEFNEFGGVLLSIALVSECKKHSFYRVLPQPLIYGEWVKENVVPFYERDPSESYNEVQQELSVFLRGMDMKDDEPLTIVADWSEDVKHLCDLLITGPGERINCPNLNFEIDFNLHCGASKVPHNAYWDAVALAGIIGGDV